MIQLVKTLYRNEGAQLRLMGLTLFVSWVVVAAVVMTGLLPPERILTYGLEPGGSGFIPLRLISYSFVHLSVSHLLHDSMWLGALWMLNVELSEAGRPHLRPTGFIRVYSLGAFGSGLLHLLLSLFWHQQDILVGSNLPILALLGAMAVLEPEPIKLFDSFNATREQNWILALIMGIAFIALPLSWLIPEATLFSKPGSYNPAWTGVPSASLGFLLPDGLLIVLALSEIRLLRFGVVWLCADAFTWLVLRDRVDVWLANAAALVMGVLYALVERWGRRFEVAA